MSAPGAITLADFVADRQWVAWRNEMRGGKLTKVPYCTARRQAEADNPETWVTHDQAVLIRDAVVNGSGGGVGIELGQCGDEWLIGIDLDTCRDPDTGAIAPWAMEVIDRFASYAEVSPSGTGVKVFATADPADVPELRTIMGNKHGRQFKRTNGSTDHPPAIELYTSNRYFAVTWEGLENLPTELRTIPLGDLEWLIEQAGPAFAGKVNGNTSGKASTDGSRSASAFRKAAALRRKGKSFEEMVAALYADPETAGWAREKGEANNQREFKRIWDKTDPRALDYFDLTEDGVALAFAAKFADQLRYCHHTGKWYEWVGTHWRLEETKLAFSWARQTCRQLAMEKQANGKMSKAATAAAVERFAQSDRAFAVTSEIWDTDPWLLGTPGGVIELRTGQLRPASQTDYITKLTAIAPAETSDCPLWLKFLQDATNSDNQLIRFLQQWIGYSLTGDTREHALLFVYGTGGNGKGVFLNTVAGILGDYCRTAAMDTFTASISDKHPTDLAMLRGARMVCASETEEGRPWAEVRIKQMTGGDTITARFMRQDFFEYRPQFKLTLIGNHRPILRNVDEAAKRRFNIGPFLHKPPVVDRELEGKIKGEWQAILRWAIEGCLDWQANGLIRPKVVLDATAEYFGEQDTLRQWLEECCECQADYADTNGSLFSSWSNYAKARGEEVGSQKRFKPAMERLEFTPIKDEHRIRGRGFRGVRVKVASPASEYE